LRFEHLAVRADDEELGMEFHDRLTIVSGLGHAERREMVELLLSSLVGGRRESSLLRYVDGTGRIVLVEADEGAVTFTYEDGSPAADPLAPLGLDLAALRKICHVKGTDMDRLAAASGGPVPPELEEARRMLAGLTEQLETADDAQRELEALRFDLAGVDEQLRDVTAGAPRRQFARLLLQLQQVRAEAALTGEQSGLAGADSDLLAKADEVSQLTGRWEGACARVEEQRARFGDRGRLDAEDVAKGVLLPSEPPANLPALASELAMAESIRADLEAQLPAPNAGKKQKKPSHPAVPQLARADQDTLWRAAHAAQVADQRVSEASLALGGLDGGAGITPSIVQELDDAHDNLERAEEFVWKGMDMARKAAVVAAFLTVMCLVVVLEGWGPAVAGLPLVPLLAGLAMVGTGGLVAWLRTAPRNRVAAAKAREIAALERAGVPTYLAFQMRRIDPTLDKNAGQALEVALADQRRSASRWAALAGDITPEAALAVEEEVRAQAAALRALDGDGSDEIRRRLIDDAEPAVARARKAVLTACAPFGVTDADHAEEEIEQLVQLARVARLQTALEAAETTLTESEAALNAVLSPLGYVEPTPLDARVRGFETAAAEADARQKARAVARPADEVEADLVRLETEVRLQAQPGWAMTATAADAAEPNIDDLQRRRTDLYSACAAAEARIPDARRLRDRVETLERRVEVLETDSGFASTRGQADPALVEEHLLGRLAIARRAGGFEPLPLLLDEPFSGATDTRLEELLDMIDRLSERVQLMYLTDDNRVVGWARARRSSHSFSLLEPTPETV
jgi:hypothetical protein